MGVFKNDYTSIPRGRIWEKKTDDGSIFQLMTGSWIRDFGQENIEALVKDEFNLQNVPFEVVADVHWDIGHGWSEEYL